MSDSAEVVVLGGGVAGLWIRAAARAAGHRVLLVDSGRLGTGQTVASQGILHAGLKYAFSPGAREVARQAAASQRAWDRALAGEGVPDLRAVRVLSRRFFMWALPGLLSKATAGGAAAALESGARRLEPAEYPEPFRGCPHGIGVWEVPERAVEPRSLVETLATCVDGEIIAQAGSVRLEGDATRVRRAVLGDGRVIEGGAFVLAAGEGNEELLRGLSDSGMPRMQRRPLQMVMVRRAPCELFGHCIQPASDRPRLTVTSARMGSEIVWYLGGELAEAGAAWDEERLIECTRTEIGVCLGWVDAPGLGFATVRVDRAEGLTPGGRRPDGPVVARVGNAVAVWPTKLVMAPTAAALAIDEVTRIIGRARGPSDVARGGGSGLPPVAPAPWEVEGVRWS